MGHEIDFTISDFVADMRAPTPSAAAELVVQNVSDLSEQIRKITRQLYHSIKRKIQHLKEKESYLRQHLPHPLKRIQDLQQYLDDLNTHLKCSFFQQTHLRNEKLRHLMSLLESLSPLKILNRGYCLVNRNDTLIKTAHELKKGEEISIRFSQSFALACVNKVGFIDNKTEKEKSDPMG